MTASDLIYQNDSRLPKKYQAFGCKSHVLLGIPQFVCLKVLTVEQMQDIIYRAEKSGVVYKNEYYLLGHPTSTDPADYYAAESWLIREAFKALGSNKKGEMVGYNEKHRLKNQWEYCDIEWQCESSNQDEQEHHTLGGKARIELWDPYKPTFSYAPKKKKVVMYRYYRTYE